jgi:hypothetical protein
LEHVFWEKDSVGLKFLDADCKKEDSMVIVVKRWGHTRLEAIRNAALRALEIIQFVRNRKSISAPLLDWTPMKKALEADKPETKQSRGLILAGELHSLWEKAYQAFATPEKNTTFWADSDAELSSLATSYPDFRLILEYYRVHSFLLD